LENKVSETLILSV